MNQNHTSTKTAATTTTPTTTTTTANDQHIGGRGSVAQFSPSGLELFAITTSLVVAHPGKALWTLLLVILWDICTLNFNFWSRWPLDP